MLWAHSEQPTYDFLVVNRIIRRQAKADASLELIGRQYVDVVQIASTQISGGGRIQDRLFPASRSQMRAR